MDVSYASVFMPMSAGILVETQGVTELRVIVMVSHASFCSTLLFLETGLISSLDEFADLVSSIKKN